MPVRQFEQSFCDVLGERVALPVIKTFYPLGFPLEIATNSEEVMEAAAESWNSYDYAFTRAPFHLRVLVEPSEGEPALEPTFRLQGGLLMIISDRNHFAVCDLGGRFGWCLTSPRMLANRSWFRWYFLEAMAYALLAQQEIVPVHAACIAHCGRGVLLCGPSGAGKSTLAFACARAGWSYLSDDATILLQGSHEREAIGKPHQFRFRPDAVRLFPELESRGAYIRRNGKAAVEIPASGFPEIATARRARIERIVFLNRTTGGPADAEQIGSQEVLERLIRESPDYGGNARRAHAETLRRLSAAPGYELTYGNYAEAVALLTELAGA